MKKTFLIFTLYSLLFIATPALAQTEYQLLQPIPLNGPGQGETQTTNASQYISGIFTLFIAIAGALAVVMIIYGGIKYMSTDAIGGKNEARETIQNAIWGLLLALGAWIILYTINPRLVNFDLSIERPPSGPSIGIGGGGVLPGYSLTPAQVAEDSRIRSELSSNISHPPVLVNNPPCTDGATIGCTNVVGLPQSAINSVISLASACSCSVTITGGTEGGHEEHGPGQAIFDLSPTSSLNSYLARTNPQAASPRNGTRVTIGSTIYTYETKDAGRSTGNHWHVNM